MSTSMVRVSAVSEIPQKCCRSSSRLTIFPSLLAKSSRISNSRLVKSKTFSSKVTSFFIKSMTNLSVTNDEGLSSKASLTVSDGAWLYI